MGDILDLLEPTRQSILLTLNLYWVKVAALVVFGWLACPMAVAVQREADRLDLHASLRQAIADAGLSEKAVAIDLDIDKSLLSLRLSGERPVTFDTLAGMPLAVRQWFLVRACERIGVPNTVTVGARLARRQARMSLHSHQKAGIA